MNYSALFLVALASVVLAAPVNDNLGQPSLQTDPHLVTGLQKGHGGPEEAVISGLFVSIR